MRTILITLLLGPGLLAADNIRVPDQHKTIQGAIDAATAADIILVSPGTYRERIKLKHGLTLRSVGSDEKGRYGLRRAEATVIDGGGDAGNAPGVSMAEGATLDGFTVTHVGSYDEATWQKHWNEKGENQSHEHIGHFGIPAIAISGSICGVVNNVVRHNGDTGIAIRGVKEQRCAPLIANNVCYRNMGGGIGSMQGSTATIDGNTCFENFHAGIGHDNAHPLVTGNVCHNNIRAGIGVSEGASPVVRGNRCHGNRRAGIGVRTGANTRPVIEDNDCYQNEMAGIGVEEEAAPIVRSNRCHHNKLAGIGCQDRAAPLVVANHCYENGKAGIGADSANPVIIRNRIERNGTAGIGIEGHSEALIIENTCEENRLVAIGIPDGGKAFLRKNTLFRTGGAPPIVAILGGGEALLIDNIIRGGGVAGVMLDGRLRAIDNVLRGENRGTGILVRPNGKATLEGNQIEGYQTAVREMKEGTVPRKARPGERKSGDK